MSTKPDWTPEPWAEYHSNSLFLTLDDGGCEESFENHQRAIKCVDACAGLQDPAAEIAALREHRSKWEADSSLEAWFPFTAEELKSLRSERDLYKAAIQMLELKGEATDKEIAALREQLEMAQALNNKATCVYCGKEMTKSAEDIYQHVTSCDKHPVKALVEANDTLREQRDALLAALKELPAGMKHQRNPNDAAQFPNDGCLCGMCTFIRGAELVISLCEGKEAV